MRGVTRNILFQCIISAVILAAFPALAAKPSADDGPDPKMLGIGMVYETSPYEGARATVLPVPFISLDHKKFFIHGVEAGYSFYDRGGLTLSVITSPRLMGYSSQDSSFLNGMEDRRMSWDAGLKAELELPFVKGLSLDISVLNDILARYDGREGDVTLEQSVDLYRVKLIFSGGVKVESSQLTNYYFGVRGNEARPDRPEYNPGTALDPYLGVTLMTGLSEQWPIVLRLGVDVLDSKVRKSPIVNDDHMLSLMLGIARKF